MMCTICILRVLSSLLFLIVNHIGSSFWAGPMLCIYLVPVESSTVLSTQKVLNKNLMKSVSDLTTVSVGDV